MQEVQPDVATYNVLLQACTMSKVEMVNVLHAADPTLWQTPHFMVILPFEECLMVGKPEACALALDQYAEQLAGLPEGAPRFLNYQGRKGLRSAYTRAERSEETETTKPSHGSHATPWT